MHERRRAALPAVAGVAVVVALAGCGGESSPRANNPRPPVLKLVTASISTSRISVSPKSFGAGPIDLVVTNQTGTAQRVTLESDIPPGSRKLGLRQVTAPINPRDTARLSADVQPGRYRVHVSSSDIRPAQLLVGRPRPSAQNDLLLP
jgi:hypothetical protein